MGKIPSFDSFGLSVISLNEIQFGIRKVHHRDPDFARTLDVWYNSLISDTLDLAVIEVESSIAKAAADFRYDCRMSYADSLIAATARVHNLKLATRNVSDFAACGIVLENPSERSIQIRTCGKNDGGCDGRASQRPPGSSGRSS